MNLLFAFLLTMTAITIEEASRWSHSASLVLLFLRGPSLHCSNLTQKNWMWHLSHMQCAMFFCLTEQYQVMGLLYSYPAHSLLKNCTLQTQLHWIFSPSRAWPWLLVLPTCCCKGNVQSSTAWITRSFKDIFLLDLIDDHKPLCSFHSWILLKRMWRDEPCWV